MITKIYIECRYQRGTRMITSISGEAQYWKVRIA